MPASSDPRSTRPLALREQLWRTYSAIGVGVASRTSRLLLAPATAFEPAHRTHSQAFGARPTHAVPSACRTVRRQESAAIAITARHRRGGCRAAGTCRSSRSACSLRDVRIALSDGAQFEGQRRVFQVPSRASAICASDGPACRDRQKPTVWWPRTGRDPAVLHGLDCARPTILGGGVDLAAVNAAGCHRLPLPWQVGPGVRRGAVSQPQLPFDQRDRRRGLRAKGVLPCCTISHRRQSTASTHRRRRCSPSPSGRRHRAGVVAAGDRRLPPPRPQRRLDRRAQRVLRVDAGRLGALPRPCLWARPGAPTPSATPVATPLGAAVVAGASPTAAIPVAVIVVATHPTTR